MGQSTYKGDSPNKKLTRGFGWLRACQTLDTLDVLPIGAVVLAGHGGDIEPLSAAASIYFKDDEIQDPYFMRQHTTAIDIDPKCVERCVQEFGCSGLIGKAEDHFHKLKYNMTHMDFCGQIGVDNLHTLVEAIANANGPSFHLVTFLKGREQDNESCTNDKLLKRIYASSNRKERRNYAKELSNSHHERHLVSLLKRGKLDVKKGLKSLEKDLDRFLLTRHIEMRSVYKRNNGKLTAFGSTFLRQQYLKSVLDVVLAETHAIEFVWGCGYQSNTNKNSGIPLITFGLMALPVKNQSEIQSSAEPYRRLKEMREQNWHIDHGARFFGTTEGELELKKFAISCERFMSLDLAAKIFNIDPLSIVAWKAHATRGSYGKEMAEYMASPNKDMHSLLTNKDRYYK